MNYTCSCPYSDTKTCYYTKDQCSSMDLYFWEIGSRKIATGICLLFLNNTYSSPLANCFYLINDTSIANYNALITLPTTILPAILLAKAPNSIVLIHAIIASLLYGTIILRNNWFSFHKEPPEHNLYLELLFELVVNFIPSSLFLIYTFIEKPFFEESSHGKASIVLICLTAFQSILSQRYYTCKGWLLFISKVMSIATSTTFYVSLLLCIPIRQNVIGTVFLTLFAIPFIWGPCLLRINLPDLPLYYKKKPFTYEVNKTNGYRGQKKKTRLTVIIPNIDHVKIEIVKQQPVTTSLNETNSPDQFEFKNPIHRTEKKVYSLLKKKIII